MIGQTQQTDSI